MKDKSRLYTNIALSATFAQTMLPTFHFSDTVTGIITTVLLTTASVFTILKQRVSVEINKDAVILTWVLAGIAALGGLNDVIGQISLTDIWQDRLRTLIAALIGILNIVSKELFPTPEGKVIASIKQDLKDEKVTI